MRCYTVSPTFDDVWPIDLTQEEYLDMIDEDYAVFLTEEEANDFLNS